MIRNNHSGNPSLSKAALLGVVVFAWLMQGCHSPLRCPVKTRLPEPCPPQLYLADVLFATDRTLINKEMAEFSGSRNLAEGHMTYGSKCEDPAGSLVGCTSSKIFEKKQEFLLEMRDRQKDVLLFVPGYKYSFDETLQLGLRI